MVRNFWDTLYIYVLLHAMLWCNCIAKQKKGKGISYMSQAFGPKICMFTCIKIAKHPEQEASICRQRMKHHISCQKLCEKVLPTFYKPLADPFCLFCCDL